MQDPYPNCKSYICFILFCKFLDTFTDTAISSSRVNGEHKEKVLQRWEGGDSNGESFELETDAVSSFISANHKPTTPATDRFHLGIGGVQTNAETVSINSLYNIISCVLFFSLLIPSVQWLGRQWNVPLQWSKIWNNVHVWFQPLYVHVSISITLLMFIKKQIKIRTQNGSGMGKIRIGKSL